MIYFNRLMRINVGLEVQSAKDKYIINYIGETGLGSFKWLLDKGTFNYS